MVYHDHDRIKAPGLREVSDQIDRDLREGAKRRGGNRGHGRRGRVSVGLHLLTKGATLNIFPDVSTHAGPPIVVFDQFFSFKAARVAGRGVIMVKDKDAMAVIRGDISAAFEEEDAVIQTPIREGGFHGGSGEAVKGMLRGKEDRVREGFRGAESGGEVSVKQAGKEGIREESDIGIIRRVGGVIRAARESIRSGMFAPRDMVEVKVKLIQGELPASLAASKVLSGAEVKKVLMVGEDNDRVWVPFEVMAPSFQGSDDGKEFPIVNLIVSFCGVKGLGKVSAGMIRSILISLEKDCSSGGKRGVCSESELS